MPNAANNDNAKASSDIEHVDWSTGTGGSGQNYANVRFGSASSQASQSSGDICRICHCESDPQNPLLTPCYCSGSLKYVHQACLQQWLTASETNACELCKFPFIMHTKIKPFNEWRSLDISGIERRRLCCSLLFHCAAALCVIWSLCVLIERAADDVQRGLIDWPFWTKLAVVTVGMTGGIVFMYIQCKAYLHLCHRWKARNRILLIQNAPEKVNPLTPPSPSTTQYHGGGGGGGGGGARRGGSVTDTRTDHRGDHRASVNANTAIDIPDNNAASSSSYSCAHGSSGNNRSIDAADIDESRLGTSSSSSIRCHHNVMHHHHHHHHNHNYHSHRQSSNLPQSPNHMLPHSDLDADSLLTQASCSSATTNGTNGAMLHTHHNQNHHLGGGGGAISQNALGQVAVAANIECTHSQHNYERDWALDDVVSQISSFRPCQQGSGSMTPFHDSIHNVLENSEDCSSRDSRQNLSTGGVSSEMGRDLTMQLSSFSGSGENKAPSIGSGVSNAVANGLGGFVYKPHNKRYSNSSIFIENTDSIALNEDVVEITGSFHHSRIPNSATSSSESVGGVGGGGVGVGARAAIVSPDETGDIIDNEKLEQFLSNRGKRRYSDTKITASNSDHSDLEAHEPMLGGGGEMNDDNDNENIHEIQQSSMPRYLEIQPHKPHNRRSTHIMPPPDARESANICGQQRESASKSAENARVLYKSLPNLNSSCENLSKK